jgi:hypothetical protein
MERVNKMEREGMRQEDKMTEGEKRRKEGMAKIEGERVKWKKSKVIMIHRNSAFQYEE